jgi:hypothetical protein
MKLPSFVSKFAAIATLAFGLDHTVSHAAVNLVTNGGFETGNFNGWTQSGDTTEAVVHAWYANTGSYGAAFGPVGSLGFISQALSTVIGDTYTLDFWLGNNDGNPNVFNVSWNGAILPSLTQTNAAGFYYTHYSISGLVATSVSTTLQFGFRHDRVYWGIDDIKVESNGPANGIPDVGASAGLLALALAALAGARRWMR